MNDWIDETIGGMKNTPQQMAEDFVRDYLATAMNVVILWEDGAGGFNYRASHMAFTDAIALCEIAKLTLFDAMTVDDEEEEP